MSTYRSNRDSRKIRGYTSSRRSYSGNFKRKDKHRKEYERLFRRIRSSKAFALLMALIFVLTIGELTGDPAIPSWTSAYNQLTESISEYIAQHSGAPATSPSDVIFHVIDVGQADSMLIQSESYNVLIDAGESGMGDIVCDYLRKQGVNQLDLIVATHPHSDHMGGMDTVIEEIGADRILMVHIPEEYAIENSFYLSVIEAVDAYGVEVVYADEGDVYRFGELTLEVLHPKYGEYREDINDLSISLSISCGGFGAIACGDITYEVEEELLEEGHNLKGDIFIANHHGSALSNSEEFIAAVSPDYVIFSCGENNSYGHPHNSVLRLLERMGIDYYRTDRNGTVVISWIDGNIYIHTEKQ